MDEKQNKAANVFRSILEREIPAGGGLEAAASARQITEPHRYYVIDGYQVLQGKFAGAERMAGYQSLVLEGEDPVEVLIASSSGEAMTYAAAWPTEAAEALIAAVAVAEDHGIDAHDFAVASVPEVGLIALWFRDRGELVPVAPRNKRTVLDPSRIYTESDVIELLHEPLAARFASTTADAIAEGDPKPPRA